jgi:repressor LexA
MGLKPLTERQEKVLEAFRILSSSQGRPPSVRDIAGHFRIQVSAAWRHLKVLSARGFLSSRNGFFSLPGSATVSVPILARVRAGIPQEAIEAPEGWLPCPASLGKGRELFALRVRGNSMSGAAILEDDLIICEQVKTAREGEIVVALLDGEATVKRLGRHGGAPALLPANPAFKPIPLKGDARITGRVLGVFRTLGKKG